VAVRFRVVVAIAWSILAGSAMAEPVPRESRLARPLSVAGVVTIEAYVPMAGVDLAYHVVDRVALDLQLVSFPPIVGARLFEATDLAAGARVFLLRRGYAGAYLAASGHYSPDIDGGNGGATVGGELGIDARNASGLVFNLAIGWLLDPGVLCHHCLYIDGDDSESKRLAFTVRVGKAF
jgi:hypothetical protein